jgi:nitronate monooxygenase
MLSGTWREPATLRTLIEETKELTDRPFGVNLVLHWPPEERLAICLETHVPLISFFWGDPTPYIQAIHDAGSQVSHTVGSAAEARAAVSAGVDVIVAQGWEAGGHVWGTVGTMALVPSVVDAVSPVPVVAAGGIGDGRGIAAALTLGAAGAWLGTRFLMSPEASVHPDYQGILLNASEADTIYTTLFDGGWPDAPHRAIRTETVKHWEAAGCPPPGQRPGEGEVVGTGNDGESIHRYADMLPGPEARAAMDDLALYAGQSVGLIRSIQPAVAIVRELTMETIDALERSATFIS